MCVEQLSLFKQRDRAFFQNKVSQENHLCLKTHTFFRHKVCLNTLLLLKRPSKEQALFKHRVWSKTLPLWKKQTARCKNSASLQDPARSLKRPPSLGRPHSFETLQSFETLNLLETLQLFERPHSFEALQSFQTLNLLKGLQSFDVQHSSNTKSV